ncbi:MAG: carboxylating nicotinate-nucleotide diphosphorylase [Anaerolineales bacterium]
MSVIKLFPDIQFQRDIVAVEALLPPELRHQSTVQIILLALIEDLTPDNLTESFADLIRNGDITSGPTIPTDKLLSGKITAKQAGVIAGLPVAEAVFKLVEPEIDFVTLVEDGTPMKEGQVAAEVNGPGRVLLTAERCALNFLGRLSGIATLTNTYVREIEGTGAIVLDTRKTLPGFRRLDKYAVRMGGGRNHRMGLYDMVMIKDNHIDGAGGIRAAIDCVRQKHQDRYHIEVEVKDLLELETALKNNVDRIMLDNMDLAAMRQAVEYTQGRVLLEASGNVSLESIRKIAETGVDYISIGALTHSVPVFDFSMRLE